jgi:hypothetical protein
MVGIFSLSVFSWAQNGAFFSIASVWRIVFFGWIFVLAIIFSIAT